MSDSLSLFESSVLCYLQLSIIIDTRADVFLKHILQTEKKILDQKKGAHEENKKSKPLIFHRRNKSL